MGSSSSDDENPYASLPAEELFSALKIKVPSRAEKASEAKKYAALGNEAFYFGQYEEAIRLYQKVRAGRRGKKRFEVV